MASERGDGSGRQGPDARCGQAKDLTDVLIVQALLIAEEQDLPLTLWKHQRVGVDQSQNSRTRSASSLAPGVEPDFDLAVGSLTASVRKIGNHPISRSRRQRSVRMRRQIRRSHGSGRPVGPWPRVQALSARVKVSETTSSASADRLVASSA